MKFLPLLFSNFKRHKLRTVLTILSIVVAFTLFGYLAAIRKAFQFGVQVAGADRLVVRHKISLMHLLPLVYEEGIEKIDGVSDATHATFFVGVYKEPKNLFPQMAVNPDEFLRMFPEFVLPTEQKQAWLQTRTGAIVGRGTAERFGFKIGDKIPLRSAIWKTKSGGYNWAFDLVGIYDGSGRDTDISNFFFRHDYLQENAGRGQGRVGWYSSGSGTRGEPPKSPERSTSGSQTRRRRQRPRARRRCSREWPPRLVMSAPSCRPSWRSCSSPSFWWQATPWPRR